MINEFEDPYDPDAEFEQKLHDLMKAYEMDQHYQVALIAVRCPRDVVDDLVRIGSKVSKKFGFSALSCMADLQKKIVKMTVGWINNEP